MCVIKYVLIN